MGGIDFNIVLRNERKFLLEILCVPMTCEKHVMLSSTDENTIIADGNNIPIQKRNSVLHYINIYLLSGTRCISRSCFSRCRISEKGY